MRPISSSGSVSPLAQSTAPRAQPQAASAKPVSPQPAQQPAPAVAPAKNPAAALKAQSHQPYMLGNAFDNYVSPTGT